MEYADTIKIKTESVKISIVATSNEDNGITTTMVPFLPLLPPNQPKKDTVILEPDL